MTLFKRTRVDLKNHLFNHELWEKISSYYPSYQDEVRKYYLKAHYQPLPYEFEWPLKNIIGAATVSNTLHTMDTIYFTSIQAVNVNSTSPTTQPHVS